MGAGDVKLLSAVGAALGAQDGLLYFHLDGVGWWSCWLSSLLWRRRRLSQTLRNLKMLIQGWFLRIPNDEAHLTIRNQRLIKLPYGVAIAVGTGLAVWLKRIPSLGF